MERVDYEELKCAILPCFLYYEGAKKEEYWIDIQNCFYHKIDDDELWEKPHWIITPYKPTGTIVKEDDDPNIIRCGLCLYHTTVPIMIKNGILLIIVRKMM